MKFDRRIAVIVALSLTVTSLTVGAAVAGMLATPLLPIAGGQVGTCVISNVTDRVVQDVTIELRNFDGGTLTPPQTPRDFGPQTSGGIARSVLANDHFRCVFRFDGSTSAVRAHVCISNGFEEPCLSTAEAR